MYNFLAKTHKIGSTIGPILRIVSWFYVIQSAFFVSSISVDDKKKVFAECLTMKDPWVFHSSSCHSPFTPSDHEVMSRSEHISIMVQQIFFVYFGLKSALINSKYVSNGSFNTRVFHESIEWF